MGYESTPARKRARHAAPTWRARIVNRARLLFVAATSKPFDREVEAVHDNVRYMDDHRGDRNVQ